jgi:hypothetical protein
VLGATRGVTGIAVDEGVAVGDRVAKVVAVGKITSAEGDGVNSCLAQPAKRSSTKTKMIR